MRNVDLDWEISCLELARRDANGGWFYYLSEDPKTIEIAYRVWLLKRQNHLVLVDTGRPLVEGQQRGLRNIVPVDKALESIGIATSQIKEVVLTHLHWDHAASANLFTKAKFYVQKSELEFFHHQAHEHPVTARFFSHRQMLNDLIASGNVVPIDGNHELYAGLNLFKVGGHTPGSQIISVDTAEGQAVIAGDVIPLNRNYTDCIPNGIFVNVIDAIAGLKVVRNLNPSILYTGHDPIPTLKLP